MQHTDAHKHTHVSNYSSKSRQILSVNVLEQIRLWIRPGGGLNLGCRSHFLYLGKISVVLLGCLSVFFVRSIFKIKCIC